MKASGGKYLDPSVEGLIVVEAQQMDSQITFSTHWNFRLRPDYCKNPYSFFSEGVESRSSVTYFLRGSVRALRNVTWGRGVKRRKNICVGENMLLIYGRPLAEGKVFCRQQTEH